MIFKSSISLLLLLISISANSKNDGDHDFTGEWYVVGQPRVSEVGWFTYWKITNANNVFAPQSDPEYSMSLKIIKEIDDRFILESEQLYRPIQIGSIIVWHEDTIEFSSGLKMIRLTGATESTLSPTDFHEYFTSTIWRYDQDRITKTFYLSDSLNESGFHSADIIIESGALSSCVRNASWSLESFNNQFVFSYNQVIDVFIIIITEANEEGLSGRLFNEGNETPVKLRRVKKADDEQIEKMQDLLTSSEWRSQNISPYTSNAEDGLGIMWYNGRKFNDIKSDDARNIVFNFKFESDNTINLYLNGNLWFRYFWEISKDAEYVIVYDRRVLQTFSAKLDNLKNIPPTILLELDYYLYKSNPTMSDEGIVVFELRAQ